MRAAVALWRQHSRSVRADAFARWLALHRASASRRTSRAVCALRAERVSETILLRLRFRALTAFATRRATLKSSLRLLLVGGSRDMLRVCYGRIAASTERAQRGREMELVVSRLHEVSREAADREQLRQEEAAAAESEGQQRLRDAEAARRASADLQLAALQREQAQGRVALGRGAAEWWNGVRSCAAAEQAAAVVQAAQAAKARSVGARVLSRSAELSHAAARFGCLRRWVAGRSTRRRAAAAAESMLGCTQRGTMRLAYGRLAAAAERRRAERQRCSDAAAQEAAEQAAAVQAAQTGKARSAGARVLSRGAELSHAATRFGCLRRWVAEQGARRRAAAAAESLLRCTQRGTMRLAYGRLTAAAGVGRAERLRFSDAAAQEEEMVRVGTELIAKEAELAEAKGAAETLEDQLREAVRRAAEGEEEAASLSEQVRERMEQCAELEERLTHTLGRAVRAEEREEAATSGLRDAEQQLAALRREGEALQREYEAERGRDAEAQQRRVAALVDRVAAAEAEGAGTAEELAAATAQLAAVERERVGAEDALEAAGEELAAVREHCRAEQQRVAEAEADAAAAREDLSAAESSCAAVEDELTSVQRELRAVREEAAQQGEAAKSMLEQQAATAGAELAAKGQALAALEEEAAEMRAALEALRQCAEDSRGATAASLQREQTRSRVEIASSAAGGFVAAACTEEAERRRVATVQSAAAAVAKCCMRAHAAVFFRRLEAWRRRRRTLRAQCRLATALVAPQLQRASFSALRKHGESRRLRRGQVAQCDRMAVTAGRTLVRQRMHALRLWTLRRRSAVAVAEALQRREDGRLALLFFLRWAARARQSATDSGVRNGALIGVADAAEVQRDAEQCREALEWRSITAAAAQDVSSREAANATRAGLARAQVIGRNHVAAQEQRHRLAVAACRDAARDEALCRAAVENVELLSRQLLAEPRDLPEVFGSRRHIERMACAGARRVGLAESFDRMAMESQKAAAAAVSTMERADDLAADIARRMLASGLRTPSDTDSDTASVTLLTERVRELEDEAAEKDAAIASLTHAVEDLREELCRLNEGRAEEEELLRLRSARVEDLCDELQQQAADIASLHSAAAAAALQAAQTTEAEQRDRFQAEVLCDLHRLLTAHRREAAASAAALLTAEGCEAAARASLGALESDARCDVQLGSEGATRALRRHAEQTCAAQTAEAELRSEVAAQEATEWCSVRITAASAGLVRGETSVVLAAEGRGRAAVECRECRAWCAVELAGRDAVSSQHMENSAAANVRTVEAAEGEARAGTEALQVSGWCLLELLHADAVMVCAADDASKRVAAAGAATVDALEGEGRAETEAQESGGRSELLMALSCLRRLELVQEAEHMVRSAVAAEEEEGRCCVVVNAAQEAAEARAIALCGRLIVAEEAVQRGFDDRIVDFVTAETTVRREVVRTTAASLRRAAAEAGRSRAELRASAAAGEQRRRSLHAAADALASGFGGAVERAALRAAYSRLLAHAKMLRSRRARRQRQHAASSIMARQLDALLQRAVLKRLALYASQRARERAQ
eukprot:TRINITY_DN18681_c0_g1_i3.p1 TRINITY_DN18681_c0_g1~~TRINITY_DN18681_c0_g1_i3.p1  ORF type:complete len:1580 (+),score=526.03 TRINITY_DN18681_c0_g1_i3:80-4741(+)